jgi:hypothetical protein
MNKAAELGPNSIAWWQDWRGQAAAIIGAGPSAKDPQLELLRDRHVHIIAINESYRLAPWAEILYSCDYAWWAAHKGLPEFAGLKLTHDRRACREFSSLHRVEIENPGSDDLLVERPSYVGAGGNSGFQAMNLAIQFGAVRIMLIGIDCNLSNGEHWHGRHHYQLNNPAESNVRRWKRAFDGAAGRLMSLGIDVVNCSPTSSLQNYPKLSISEALKRWDP